MKKGSPGGGAPTRWVALLRGINVGGHKPVKMDELKRLFASLGFQSCKTILASGNVLFESPATDRAALVRTIEEALARTFRHDISVALRTVQEIQELVESEPFAKVAATPQTRLYVTFLAKGGSKRSLPAGSPPGADFTIVRVTPGEVCIALTLTQTSGTPELMSYLDKELGRTATTRNWNTVAKILKG